MVVESEFLKNISYFAGLSATELELIKKLIVEKTADRGEMLTLEGEKAGALYFVVSGVLKAFKTSVEGKEQILSIIRPGESFNEVAVFDDASLISEAPIFSNLFLRVISLATLTPSFVERGDPYPLLITTLRPRGPKVTTTAFERVLTPFSIDLSASSRNLSIFGITFLQDFS